MSPEEAGTPKPNDGDAAGDDQGKTATSAEEDREEPDYKELYLSSKDKVERVNELERQNAALEERLARSPAAEAPNGRTDKRLARDKQLADWADKGDPAAATLLELRQEIASFASGVRVLRQIDRLPAEERDAAEAEFHKELERDGDIDAAWRRTKERQDQAKESKLKTENEALRKRIQQLEAGHQEERPVQTEHREVTAKQNKVLTMTEADFDAKVAALKAEGRNSEAMQLQRDYAEDRVRLK